MLTPDPRYLRSLLARYADLRIAHSRGEKGLEQRLDDVTYTLCVATGTTCVEDALATADALLAEPAGTTASPALEAARTELAA
ncbi:MULTISPECIES: DUF5133 domain-containing protein [Streptomyces]|uniref:DUF5133 domain-containing protein n=1 Tax=Streptomyces sudanensis TaxID=436397 RepID=A0ABY4TCI6_9ACTN|nr:MULTISPECIES: DUF5133 domain-containing protein [Streptomyces]MCP9958413.1 DUF5133 domain-containing protein [Streptomyces sudanensis]MCP9987545.1 DUF5133 domain-containing protein [Streptomyces sudanensis]MCQ0001073.1 DUF5133 domain-containing protein [Streptomyces sudanensis]URN16665.1 DUF5133 domain-containing protein [Streptomyces sudanensis]